MHRHIKEQFPSNPFSGDILDTYRKGDQLRYHNREKIDYEELFSRAGALVIVMATSYNHHKYVGLRTLAGFYDFVSPVGNGRLPIIITSSKPTECDESIFNKQLIRGSGLIPALKTEQIYLDPDDTVSALQARWNYYRGVLEAETKRRRRDYGYGGNVLQEYGTRGLVAVAASDITLHQEDAYTGNMVALFQPGKKDLGTLKEEIRQRLLPPGKYPGTPLTFKAQIDIAAKLLMLQGYSLDMGVALRGETYFMINALSNDEFESYWNNSDKNLIQRVNGGLIFADGELHDKVYNITHDGNSQVVGNELAAREELALRLRSNTPLIIDLVGEAIACTVSPPECCDGLTADVEKAISVYMPHRANVDPAMWVLMNSVRNFRVPKTKM